MESSTILQFITEIKDNHKKFVETRIADPVTKTALGEILQEMNLSLDVTSANIVLRMFAQAQDRVLTEGYARNLLERIPMQVAIQNRKLFFSEKDEQAQFNIVQQLHKLDENQLEDLVKALKRASGDTSKPRVPRQSLVDKVRAAMKDGEALTVKDMITSMGWEHTDTNVKRIKKAAEKLVNAGELCYSKDTPGKFSKVSEQ